MRERLRGRGSQWAKMPYRIKSLAGPAIGIAVALFTSAAEAAPCALERAIGSAEAAARGALGSADNPARAADALSAALSAVQQAPRLSEAGTSIADYTALRRQQITALRRGDMESARALALDPRASSLARSIAAASAAADCPEREPPQAQSDNAAIRAAAEAAVASEATNPGASGLGGGEPPATGGAQGSNEQRTSPTGTASGHAPPPDGTSATLPAFQAERRITARSALDIERLTFSSILPYLPFVLVLIGLLGAFRFENRRVHPRFNCSAPLALRRGGAMLKTMVLDISRSGAKIRHDDDPIAKGETVSLTIAGAEVKANVIWSNAHYSGLKFTGLISEAQVNTVRASAVQPKPKTGPAPSSGSAGAELGAGSVTLGKIRPKQDASTRQGTENQEI